MRWLHTSLRWLHASLRTQVTLLTAVALMFGVAVSVGGCGGSGGSPVRPSQAPALGASTEAGVSRTGSAALSSPTHSRVSSQSRIPSAAEVRKRLGEKCRMGCARLVTKFGGCLLKNDVEIPHAHSDFLYGSRVIKTRSLRVKAVVGECRKELLGASSG
jgi:hypothetical protein